MKITVIYRPNSEHARGVETFLRDFQSQHPSMTEAIEVLDYDSREGIQAARVHDIVAQPAILVTQNDGTPIKEWRDGSLPQLQELATYAYGNA